MLSKPSFPSLSILIKGLPALLSKHKIVTHDSNYLWHPQLFIHSLIWFYEPLFILVREAKEVGAYPAFIASEAGQGEVISR